MSTWLVNDASPESLGLSVVGGVFRNGSASHVQLRCSDELFDATEAFGYNSAVVIKLNGSAFFRGKVRAIPKSASGSDEAQDYVVEDAWAELERTTYQEPWAVNGGTVLMPRVYLGVDSSGDRITLGEQIAEALDFAIAAGVSLQKGSIPSGMLLWPQEVDGMSCAEVIRTSLRYHPDWLPWIDHSTSPPTFNVTPVASATALSKAITDCEDVNITELQDRLPSVVRICFVTANIIDDEVKRQITVQKYPTDGADSGPGVLATTVDLQGVRSTLQKQQIQTRHIPVETEDTALTAKAWLKLKVPALAGVDNAKFNITAWEREIVAETETPPDPINPAAVRLGGPASTITLSDVPRELVKGAVHEWMQKKVGRVYIKWTIEPDATANDAERKLIARAGPGMSVVATNAITKVYRGIASWTAAETAPSGIAQTYYQTIHAAARYEGTITIPDADLSARWHGKKLNLTGGATAWATMAAPIHSVSWNAHRGDATITFGPSPDYALQDFIEYLKLLRRREPSWISTAERISEELGDEAGASAHGDNIGGLDLPRDTQDMAVVTQQIIPFRLSVFLDGSNWKWKVSSEYSSITDGTNGPAIDLSTAGFDGSGTTISADKYIVLEAESDSDLVLTDWTLAAVDSAAADEVRFTTTGTIHQDRLRLLIGKVTFTSGVPAAKQAVFSPQMITHGLTNGKESKVFLAPTVHKSLL
jgi:hypothetical protein